MLLLRTLFTLAAFGCLVPACKPKEPAPSPIPPVVETPPPNDIGEILAGDRCELINILRQVEPKPGVRADAEEFKLRGIKCPELTEPGGPEARAFAVGFLATKLAWVHSYGRFKADPMGEYSEVFRYPDRAHLNAELVRFGHARVTDPAPEYAERLQRLEADARAQKLGIWK